MCFKLGLSVGFLVLTAWLLWLTINFRGPTSENSVPASAETFSRQIIRERLIDSKITKIEKLLEKLLYFKDNGNRTELDWTFVEHWSGSGPLKSYSSLVPKLTMEVFKEAGKALVNTLNIVQTVFLSPLQTSIKALEEKIMDIQSRIAELTKEEREKIPEALALLYSTQQDLMVTRESLVSLADDTMVRVKSLIRALVKMGPNTKKVGKRVKAILKKFEKLLTKSQTDIKDAQKKYEEMYKNLNMIKGKLAYFASSILRMVEGKEADMHNWIKKTRINAYCGCFAAVFNYPICMAVAVPIVEVKVSEYRSELSYLKRQAKSGSAEAAKLADHTKKNVEYITEEVMLLERWDDKIKLVSDEFEDVFNDPLELADYIDIEGKEETIEMLCSLSAVCKTYIEHKYHYGSWDVNIPKMKITDQHPLCGTFKCTKSSPKLKSPPKIGQLQLGNIEILGSIGDSLSAAAGYEVDDPDRLKEKKLLSFVSGASPNVYLHSSLYNILLEFSPNLLGGSTGGNIPGNYGPAAGLNFATDGATIRDCMKQAKELVAEIKKVDGWENRWKLITFQFGLTDLCSAPAFGEEWAAHLASALTTLKNELPKTVVLLLAPVDVTSFKRPGCLKPIPKKYNWMTPDIKCRNEISKNAQLLEWLFHDLANKFRDQDFGVEVLPALKNFKVDTEEKEDCVHPSENDLSKIGKNLWNNFVTPGAKRTSDYSENLEVLCPDPDAYIPLTKPGSIIQPIKLHSTPDAAKDMMRIQNDGRSKDYIQVEFRKVEFSVQTKGYKEVCTTAELNTLNRLNTLGNHMYNYSAIDKCYFQEKDQIQFRLKTQKQTGLDHNDEFCLTDLKLALPKMRLKFTRRTCAEGPNEDWQDMTSVTKTCGLSSMFDF